MKDYVLGFLFSGTRVMLIQKTRPQWQKGKLNGIGGHIEEGESSLDAMIREAQEEAGLHVTDWKEFATLRGSGRAGAFELRVFSARMDSLQQHVFSTEEGVVRFYTEGEWRDKDRVDNLDILIPAALVGKHYLTIDYLGDPDALPAKPTGTTPSLADLVQQELLKGIERDYLKTIGKPLVYPITSPVTRQYGGIL